MGVDVEGIFQNPVTLMLKMKSLKAKMLMGRQCFEKQTLEYF